MQAEYKETGGLRYGHSYWASANFTYPFATLSATPEALSIKASLLGLCKQAFTFDRCAIRSIIRKRAFFGIGIIITHTVVEYPPFILFWTFSYKHLKAKLQMLGYDVFDSQA